LINIKTLNLRRNLFPYIIAASALSVSASAAFYSVTGLSMLFAGASTAVAIMASSLEVSKLVIASLLYQYWTDLNKVLKIYLTIAVAVLILITSAGIYGYLSSAYQETANKSSVVDSKILALETKKKLYEDTRNNILKEKQSLVDLKGALTKTSTTQYTDRNGNLVVRSNNASFKQIESASKSDEKLSSKVDIVNDSIFALENRILEIKTNSQVSNELGPLKYLSNLTGYSMDKIINWFLIVIIFVFDPLAIALVIAANFAFTRLKQPKTPKLTEEDKEWLDASLVDELEWDEYSNPSFIIKEEPEYKENIYGETPNAPVSQTKSLTDEELFDQIDTNDDGIIDDTEAAASGLSKEEIERLRSISAIQDNPNISSFRKRKLIERL
jgi:hypothetical protein